eukprot:c36690_g1_i1 orf=2-1054(-)
MLLLKLAPKQIMSAHQLLLRQSKVHAMSLPIFRNTNRAFHGTFCQNLALISDFSSGCSSKALALSGHGSSGLHSPLVGSQVLLKGRASMGYLGSQKRTLKGKAAGHDRGSFEAEAARHEHGVRFELAQETNLGEDEAQHSAAGSIHLIVGPMFAGKTTALLKRVEAETSTGRRIALVKSDKDTRYGLASIVSHDGRQMPCWAVSSLANFRSQIGEDEYAKLDLIGIDEAQFLKDLYSFCQVAADYEGKTLIIAGLDGDFQRNKFGSILDLVPLADSVVKLSSRCELCGKPASFTFRKTDNRNKEVIGGTDIYMPVCRQHYFSRKFAVEATRTILDTHKFVPLQCDMNQVTF